MIIGLTGTFGAGKGAVADILKKKGFAQLVMSDVLREECRKEGVEESRDNLLAMGNKLRAESGSGVIMKKLIDRAREEDYEKVIIDGLRSIGEAEELKKNKGILISVDAPLEMRYERIAKRGTSKDNISFEEFKKQEENEMGKPGAQINECVRIADYKITNDGDIDELEKKVSKILAELE
jgi:dephospho-CoA kinase